jgi:hypothetical protein
MASSQSFLVIPELRINTYISMKVFGFSVNVSSVRDGICFFAPYFARHFMSGILAAIEYEGIPSLKDCL